MRRCLCPGGLLRTGRGSILSSRRVFPHTATSRLQAQPSSTKCNLTPKDNDFLLSHTLPTPSPLRAPERHDIDAWLPLLEKCVTPIQREESPLGKAEVDTSLLDHAESLNRGHALRALLNHARSGAKFQLLNHLGFNLGQWSYVYRLLGTFIDTYEVLIPYMTPQRPSSCFAWKNTGISLDELTGTDHKNLTIIRESIPIFPPSENFSLAMLAGARPAARESGRLYLGEILVNLGSLVLEAADRPAAESELAMSCVYRILARLHHMGLISDRVYESPNDKTNTYSLRPPGLNLLSSHIMSVQSDAAWLEHESKLATAATEAGEEPPFVPFKLGVRELGHEIWLELILWCCVEHGFNKQGAWLMGQMCELESQPNWKIESWAPLMEAFDLVQQTNISTEQSWRRSGQESSAVTPRGAKKLPFNGLGKRTISSEVVSNLRNGLANVTCTGIGFGGATSAELLDYSRPLTALLDPPGPVDELRPTKRVTTENITRILESGVLKPMEDPVAFEEVLRSTQNLVPSWETDAVPSAEDLDHMTRAQIYDQTAALSGLVQYSIKGYTYKRQATQAFLQYAWLQNIVDASKVQHIQAFFEHHSQSQLTELPFFDSRQLNTSQLQQSSLPQVSLTTLADLLDLATATHAHDFGNWLLFNDDLDGPSIPPAAYGKQVLVPSILRFASATRNNELSQAVIRSLELPLSVNTLKAMANLHMEFADWDRAILAFEYLRDFRLKSWGFSNIFTLGAKIIRLESALRLQQEAKDADEEKQKRLNHNLQCAKQLLRRFFKGEFNTPRSKAWRQNDFQWRVLYRARGIFRTLDGELEALAKNTNFKRKFADRDRIHGVPAASFHRLLAAVLDVHGSKIGHEFAAHWLRSTPSPVSWRLLKGGVTRQQRHVERELLAIDPTFKPARFEQYKNEAVVPDLNTIRLVARAAMSELEVAQQEKTEKPESPSASTATTELDVAQQEKIEQLKEKLNPRPRSQGYKLRISKSVCKNMTLKGGRPPSSDPEAVLDWCATFLLRLGMGEETIDLEIPGHTNRLRRRGVLTTTPEKRLRDRFKDIRNSPWMSTSVKIKDADIDEST